MLASNFRQVELMAGDCKSIYIYGFYYIKRVSRFTTDCFSHTRLCCNEPEIGFINYLCTTRRRPLCTYVILDVQISFIYLLQAVSSFIVRFRDCMLIQSFKNIYKIISKFLLIIRILQNFLVAMNGLGIIFICYMLFIFNINYYIYIPYYKHYIVLRIYVIVWLKSFKLD